MVLFQKQYSKRCKSCSDCDPVLITEAQVREELAGFVPDLDEAIIVLNNGFKQYSARSVYWAEK